MGRNLKKSNRSAFTSNNENNILPRNHFLCTRTLHHRVLGATTPLEKEKGVDPRHAPRWMGRDGNRLTPRSVRNSPLWRGKAYLKRGNVIS
ncbi:hypothetical protein CDAR_517011 [Caerostris darwini]|uniref:Ribosomal protein L2 n=1 Tax=Caerostris darwini TaxID=1538125 RepID=A0AAV4UE11_9ARAC|nr:hypothetical protein CDAR_517011 [Caerostris darwini]